MKKTKLLWVFFALIVFLSLTACSALPGGDKTVRQITASGQGKVYLTPDVAFVQIGVESRSDQVANALSENNAQTESVSSTLQELGVEAKDIQTSAFNIFPQQEYNQLGEMTGTVYVVNNTVYVTVRDLQSLGKLLDAVVRSGANNIYGIQFDVQDKAKAISEARKLAINDAKANAQEIAAAADIELGDLITLNVYNMGGPVPMFDGKGGAGFDASVPVSAGQLTMTMNADLTYEIK